MNKNLADGKKQSEYRISQIIPSFFMVNLVNYLIQ